MRAPRLGVQAGVVGSAGDALARQPRGGLVHRRARTAVDDARLARVLGAKKRSSCRAALSLSHDPVADVRPVEAGDERARAPPRLQPRDDLGARGCVGGGGQGDARHAREALVQRRRAPGTPAGSRGPTATRSAPRRWRTARSCRGRAARTAALGAAAAPARRRAGRARRARTRPDPPRARGVQRGVEEPAAHARARAARRPGPASAR